MIKRASGSERVGGAERGVRGPASDAVGVPAGAKPLGFFSKPEDEALPRYFGTVAVGRWSLSEILAKQVGMQDRAGA